MAGLAGGGGRSVGGRSREALRSRARPLGALLALLALVLGALLAPRDAGAQDNAALAQLRFSRGVQLYSAHDFEAALSEFRAAQSLYASPNSRFYIARCLRDLGRLAEAVPEMELALQEAEERARTDPRYRATRDAARRMLQQLVPQVGRATINAARLPPGARIRLGERDIPVEALGVSLPVMPGHQRLTVEASGYRTFTREVDITAGQSVTVDVAPLERAPEATGTTTATTSTTRTTGTESSGSGGGGGGAVVTARVGSGAGEGNAAAPTGPVRQVDTGTGNGVRAVGGVLIGLGAAGLISFGVFGALTLVDYNNFASMCNPTPCPDNRRGEVLTAQTFQLVANASLIGGATAVVIGTIMVLAAPRAPSPPRRAGAARASPLRVGLGFGGVSVGGTF